MQLLSGCQISINSRPVLFCRLTWGRTRARSRTVVTGPGAGGSSRAPTSWLVTTASTPETARSSVPSVDEPSHAAITSRCTWSDTSDPCVCVCVWPLFNLRLTRMTHDRAYQRFGRFTVVTDRVSEQGTAIGRVRSLFPSFELTGLRRRFLHVYWPSPEIAGDWKSRS